MCRSVIVVIFVSCVSFGVLAEGETATQPNKANLTCTKDDPELIKKRLEWHKCFNNTVKLHLHPGETVTGDCHTATAFGEKVETYIQFVNTRCNKKLTLNTTNLIKLMEFSLKNDSFKKFYADIKCVERNEYNISNNCVKDRVGFFNVTQEKKHTTWANKTKLHYSALNCDTNKKVGDCVQAYLHSCNADTEEYIKNLFNYARELGSCSQFHNTPLLQPGKSGAAAASWLTLPVIITLSIGAVVVVVAIIIIIVSKCQNK